MPIALLGAIRLLCRHSKTRDLYAGSLHKRVLPVQKRIQASNTIRHRTAWRFLICGEQKVGASGGGATRSGGVKRRKTTCDENSARDGAKFTRGSAAVR